MFSGIRETVIKEAALSWALKEEWMSGRPSGPAPLWAWGTLGTRVLARQGLSGVLPTP